MSKKPNIIFILTDDQGAWALRCAGNTDINTPNLDYLASEGTRFENFFCVSPVCSPARASILTGMIPSQHGVHDWLRSGNLDKKKLGDMKDAPRYNAENKPIQYLEGKTTYTDVLAENGYTCALSGKWHLGDSRQKQHGFSKWFTIGGGGCPYYAPDLVEKDDIHIDDKYITDTIANKALEFMDELGDKESPYYLSVNFTAPHSPWEESDHPKEYIEMYRNCEFKATPDLPVNKNQIPSAPYGTGERRKELLRGYYAAISAMDYQVGRIIQKLKDRNEWDNTILVFSADNGMNMGHHGIWGKGNGTFPFNLYDTSVKIPFIIRTPDFKTKGTVLDTMHSHYDVLHTLLDLVGIHYEFKDNLPGRSFKQELLGHQGVDEHVVICDEYGANRMLRTREWKYIRRYPYGEDELYDLVNDPGEENNLVDNEQYKEKRIELNKMLMNWFFKYTDPSLDATKERVTGYGQLGRAGIYATGDEYYGTRYKK